MEGNIKSIKRRKIISAGLIAAALILTTVQIAPAFLQRAPQRASKNALIASHIYDSVSKSIEKPIIVAESMNADTFLQNALKNENSAGEKEMEQAMATYLTSIKEKFGYMAAFVVSENTHRYYTPRGISKIVNPQTAPYDVWYQLFLDSGKDRDLDTDRDQANDYRWTVFVNTRIIGADGSLLGVCGVGVFMDDLQNLIAASEKEYGVKISLIDTEGLVQVDTDSTTIENTYIYDAIADNATADAFTYTERRLGGFRMTRYLSDLEWYLVVRGGIQLKSGNGIKVSLALLYVFLALSLVSVCFGQKCISGCDAVKSDSSEDGLTGLPNRNYLKESYGEMGVFNTTRYKSLAVFNIDSFNEASETMDGDEIILIIVDFAKKAVGERGLLFRWRGDEFVAFLEMTVDEAEEKFKAFCEQVKGRIAVTVSVGIVEVDLSESIKTNYHRAVQPCYAVKEAGGNGVGIR